MSLQKTILPARAMFAGGLMLAATLPCATINVLAAEVPPAPKPAVPIRTMLAMSAAGRHRRVDLQQGMTGLTVPLHLPIGRGSKWPTLTCEFGCRRLLQAL